MSKLKPSFFYKFNLVLEIVLFSISVVVLNIFIGIQNWIAVSIASILIIAIEIFLKVKGYNMILSKARERENRSITIENQGITNHYFMRDLKSQNERNLAILSAIEVSNELFLLAETGKSYIDIATDRHWKSIKKRIDNGVRLRILLINPLSENKKFRNQINGVSEDRKFEMDRILELSNHQNVSIRFTNESYCSLFFTETYMIYDPYHLGRIGDRIENNFIALEFTFKNDNYNILKDHFNNCWENAIEINEFKKINTHI